MWLEQTKPGVFKRHVIEVGQPTHATLDVGDYDHDGDIDIVVGNFSMGGPVQGPSRFLRTSGSGRARSS